MKTLTVFTPTYNRAYCLDKLYVSLCNQNSKDFIWLIIDDGSQDNTKELVNKWKNDCIIDIKYIFQENQGMHGAHNTAYENIETEINTCIDSDDYIADNAVNLILEEYKTIKNLDNIAGLVGLDVSHKGEIIGTKMPKNIKYSRLYDLYHNYGVKGDKKLVYKTEVVKKYPRYPLFEGERFVPLGYLYQLIDQSYKLKIVNEVFCVVEYMEDGSTKNILNQYRKNPKGFAFSRKSRMEMGESFKEVFKNSIHYVSSSLFIKNYNFIFESPKKIITVLAVPLGILLNFYIRLKTTKQN